MAKNGKGMEMEIVFLKDTPNGIKKGTCLAIAEIYAQQWIDSGYAVSLIELQNAESNEPLTSTKKKNKKK